MRWKGPLDSRHLGKQRERKIFAWFPLYDRESNTYYWLERVVVFEKVEEFESSVPLVPEYRWVILEVDPV